ncbi:MAG: alanine racemase, partial [Planctomycetota bacterium]
MEPTSRIEIDLSVLEANLAAWRAALTPGCELCAVVKADAYGLGAVPISRRLVAAGVNKLAVYSLGQATAIAATGLPVSLMVLMPADEISRTDILYRSLVAGRLELVVHSTDQLLRIEALGRMFGTAIPVHFEVDTGMSRGGMSIAQADDLLAALPIHRYTKLVGVFTHPTSADTDADAAMAQFGQFEALLGRHKAHLGPEVKAHFSNTPAAVRSSRYHQGMVRIGLGLLGYGVEDLLGESDLAQPPDVKPVMRWTSTVVHQLEVPAGAGVGYHGTLVTERATRLGIVPVGYGDGYPLGLSNVGVVRVGAGLAPA